MQHATAGAGTDCRFTSPVSISVTQCTLYGRRASSPFTGMPRPVKHCHTESMLKAKTFIYCRRATPYVIQFSLATNTVLCLSVLWRAVNDHAVLDCTRLLLLLAWLQAMACLYCIYFSPSSFACESGQQWEQ